MKGFEAEPDRTGRVDLKLRFNDEYSQRRTFYHRVVGLTLLRCWWDDQGRLLREGYVVPLSQWGRHRVHHLDGTWDVSLKNLAVVTKPCHDLCTDGYVLPEPPVGWGQR